MGAGAGWTLDGQGRVGQGLSLQPQPQAQQVPGSRWGTEWVLEEGGEGVCVRVVCVLCAWVQLGLNMEGLGIWSSRYVGAVLGCANVLAQAGRLRYGVAV